MLNRVIAWFDSRYAPVALAKDTQPPKGVTAFTFYFVKQFSTAFLLGNKYCVGNMKKFLKPFGAHFEENSIEKLVRDVVKDVRIAATVTNRVDKEDPDKIYGGVKDITVM